MVLKPVLVDLNVDLVNFHSHSPLASPAHLLEKFFDPSELPITYILQILPSIYLMDPIYLISFVFFIPALFSLVLSFLYELDIPLDLLHP